MNVRKINKFRAQYLRVHKFRNSFMGHFYPITYVPTGKHKLTTSGSSVSTVDNNNRPGQRGYGFYVGSFGEITNGI